jgi:hypothetical protein
MLVTIIPKMSYGQKTLICFTTTSTGIAKLLLITKPEGSATSLYRITPPTRMPTVIFAVLLTHVLFSLLILIHFLNPGHVFFH